MAAPQIPNLNLLRARGGRNRMRGRGQGTSVHESGSSAEGEANLKDRTIQQTDVDASLSRLSAVEVGYLEDPFAHLFVSSEAQRRFPIINRGTYVRTKAIDNLVDLFLSDVSSSRKQIISLGAGSDTRFFRLIYRYSRQEIDLAKNLRANLVYHEFDFLENVSKKKAAINQSPILSNIVGDPYSTDLEDGLDSSNYYLHSLDLRALDPETPIPSALREINATLPTIIISECCLVYLDPDLADKAARYFTQTLFPQTTSVGMILYEPILPDDAFGKVMVSNLAARGIVLQTLRKYGSLDAQAARMKAYGFGESAGTDMNGLWRDVIDEEEKARVATLEMLDEVEEWEMLAGHYCVIWAWRSDGKASIWDGWKQMKANLVRE